MKGFLGKANVFFNISIILLHFEEIILFGGNFPIKLVFDQTVVAIDDSEVIEVSCLSFLP